MGEFQTSVRSRSGSLANPLKKKHNMAVRTSYVLTDNLQRSSVFWWIQFYLSRQTSQWPSLNHSHSLSWHIYEGTNCTLVQKLEWTQLCMPLLKTFMKWMHNVISTHSHVLPPKLLRAFRWNFALDIRFRTSTTSRQKLHWKLTAQTQLTSINYCTICLMLRHKWI
jgi:hypothetical protein